MPSVTQILDLARVGYARYERASIDGIFLTTGNQLIGTYAAEKEFVRADKAYHGWQAHHVVESQDLARLHVHAVAPPRDDQLCVLLPERAHIGRFNSILRNRAPQGQDFSPRQLLEAYAEAYGVIGDYCGGGERLLRRELLDIVHATFRVLGLI